MYMYMFIANNRYIYGVFFNLKIREQSNLKLAHIVEKVTGISE